MPAEISDLFHQHVPVSLCSSCGLPLEVIFNRHELSYHTMDCQPCRLPELQAKVDKQMEHNLYQRGLEPIFKQARLSDFPKNVVNAIPKDRGAYLWGPCGTGKTHLLSALLRDIAEARSIRMDSYKEFEITPLAAYPLMTSIQEILLDVRRTFTKNADTTESEIIDRVTFPPVLLLDDIGTEKPTDWALQTTYLIIDRRYREQRRTFFSSNLSLSDLSERLGDRIASRIAGMCKVIQLNGSDRRLKG